MRRSIAAASVLFGLFAGCSSSDGSGNASLDGGGGTGTGSDGGGSGSGGDGGLAVDSGSPLPDAGPPPSDIGTWTDAPGSCPTGMNRVDLATAQDLMDASRGENARAADPADTCYVIKNGTYQEAGSLLLYVTKSGATTAGRRFVGESRAGVVIHGRASIADGVGHIVLENMTFDLTGYAKAGSFNTVDVLGATDVTISHVTLTGDCATGFRGGHIEVSNGATTVLIDSCLVEKFGQCASGGHEDHGIYLAAGKGITIRSSVIRGNSSRGIQFNTEGGAYGKIDGVLVEYNRIYDNGHADYEDGIVVNMTGTGNVDNVTIRRNLIYGNYYSGLRFSGAVTSKIDVQRNTFFGNGIKSTGNGRSNVNLDDVGSGANTTITKNIFALGKALLNDCYDAAPRGFSVADDVVFSSVNATGAGGCISSIVTADPQFTDGAAADFHVANPAVSGYGAY